MFQLSAFNHSQSNGQSQADENGRLSLGAPFAMGLGMTFVAASFPRVFCLGSLVAVAVVAGLPGLVAAQSATYTPYQPATALAAPAPAAPAEVVPVPPPAAPLVAAPAPALVPARRWYGYQLMLSDATMVGLAFALDSPEIAFGVLAAPAVIHGLHHNTGMAIASPFLRIGLPVLGATVGASAAQCTDNDSTFLDFCPLGEMIIGAYVGLLVAGVVDYAAAWQVDTTPTIPTTAARRSSPRVTLSTAGVAPIPNGATLVLGGRY